MTAPKSSATATPAKGRSTLRTTLLQSNAVFEAESDRLYLCRRANAPPIGFMVATIYIMIVLLWEAENHLVSGEEGEGRENLAAPEVPKLPVQGGRSRFAAKSLAFNATLTGRGEARGARCGRRTAPSSLPTRLSARDNAGPALQINRVGPYSYVFSNSSYRAK